MTGLRRDIRASFGRSAGDADAVRTRAGWAERLRGRGYALRGHRLVWDRAEDGVTGTGSHGRSE